MHTNILNEIKKLVQKSSTPRWMSIKEAVEMSGLSDSTLRRAIISGELKASKKGKWLIKDSWLERYLTS